MRDRVDDSESTRNWELNDRIDRDEERERSYLRQDLRRRLDSETARERSLLIGARGAVRS